MLFGAAPIAETRHARPPRGRSGCARAFRNLGSNDAQLLFISHQYRALAGKVPPDEWLAFGKPR